MKYEILGPLRVTDEHGSHFISAPKVEMVLAVLLIQADRLVTTTQLLREVWHEEVAPRRANASLHVYISHLRKFLQRPNRPASPIVTRPQGYLLEVGTDELDLHVFLDRVRQGRELRRAGRDEEVVESLDRALGMWRGPLLSDLPRGPIVSGLVTWLRAERLECIELLIESRLSLGQHREVVGWLYSLVAEYPFHEPFYRQLMIGLYRAQRQAEALEAYDRARGMLDGELGVEPCRTLRELQWAILSADPSLDLPLEPAVR